MTFEIRNQFKKNILAAVFCTIGIYIIAPVLFFLVSEIVDRISEMFYMINPKLIAKAAFSFSEKLWKAHMTLWEALWIRNESSFDIIVDHLCWVVFTFFVLATVITLSLMSIPKWAVNSVKQTAFASGIIIFSIICLLLIFRFSQHQLLIKIPEWIWENDRLCTSGTFLVILIITIKNVLKYKPKVAATPEAPPEE